MKFINQFFLYQRLQANFLFIGLVLFFILFPLIQNGYANPVVFDGECYLIKRYGNRGNVYEETVTSENGTKVYSGQVSVGAPTSGNPVDCIAPKITIDEGGSYVWNGNGSYTNVLIYKWNGTGWTSTNAYCFTMRYWQQSPVWADMVWYDTTYNVPYPSDGCSSLCQGQYDFYKDKCNGSNYIEFVNDGTCRCKGKDSGPPSPGNC